jgi:hypothetical protein
MHAGLALERNQVLLANLASISAMRNSNSGLYMLAWFMMKAFGKDPRRWQGYLTRSLTYLLAITTALSQFTSTTLLSDLRQGLVPGQKQKSTAATNFVPNVNGTIPVTYHRSVWSRKPPLFPTFAEYHENPVDVPSKTMDTGRTIRAFLPFQNQDTRSFLGGFSGKATAFDARVVCTAPTFTAPRVHLSLGYGSIMALDGNISTQGCPERRFACIIPCVAENEETNRAEQWSISLCQIASFSNSSTAPIESVFQSPNSKNPYGMAYVAVNISLGSVQEWIRTVGIDAGEFNQFGTAGYSPVLVDDNHGEWNQLLFTQNASLRLSVSLCFSSMDSAVLDLHGSSRVNRTEPSPEYLVDTRSYSYKKIRQQLGQSTRGTGSLTLEDRGVLALSTS